MSKEIFEEKGGPHRGHAAGDTDLEKQASQLASDVKYKVKQRMSAMGGASKMSPAQVSKAYLAQLAKSPASSSVKALAKKKLMPKPEISEQFNADDIVKESLLFALNKVFVDGNTEDEDVGKIYENEYLLQLEETGERKYKIRVTDKKTGNNYVRMATREKIAELRANPNISSVEMTQYGEVSDSEKSKGESTAKAKSGKGLDPVGKEDNDPDNDGVPISKDKNDQYIMKRRKAIGNAISKRKGFGEQFEYLFEVDKKNKSENRMIDIKKGKNNCVTISPEVSEEVVVEMSVSKDQQRAAGAALSAKRGETDPSTLKGASRQMYDSMTEKQLRDFAKTKHEGLPEKVHSEGAECGCDDKDKDKDDMRSIPTKMSLVKNKLRAIGLKMSYEPEGENIDEVAGALLRLAGAAAGAYAAGKGLESMKNKVDTKIDSARKNSKIGGDRYADQLKQLRQSYEPEGEVLDERRKEDKVAGTPRKPRDRAFELVAKSMGAGRMGVQPRGKKKEPGKKPPEAGKYGSERESPAQTVTKRRAAAQRAQEFMSDTRGT